MSDIVLVMVHVWEDMPELENIRWQEFSTKIVQDVNELYWPKIWQFDFIDCNTYHSLKINKKDFDNKLTDSGKVPHHGIKYADHDWISTSDQQTADIIRKLDPPVVIFGGLHKDLCVHGVKLAVEDDLREYFVSDRLAYTWKETASAIYKDWGK